MQRQDVFLAFTAHSLPYRNDDDVDFINNQIAELMEFVKENYADLEKLLKKRKKRKPAGEAAAGANDDDMEDDADEEEPRGGKKRTKKYVG